MTGTALAQNADAEVLFNEAVQLETEGKVPEACNAFEASNRIEPRAGTLIRLGQCREKQGLMVSAWSAYKDSLTRVKDPKKRKLAQDRVNALEPTLSYLTVSVPDDVRVDGLVVTRNGSRWTRCCGTARSRSTAAPTRSPAPRPGTRPGRPPRGRRHRRQGLGRGAAVQGDQDAGRPAAQR
ncbi:MAG: hypothetical protein IPL61_11900 [Myxococcales bacterium]|nr:hypothetical protein [Myxococcales bacterium]